MPIIDKKNSLNLRSEEINEILTKPPVWIVRWGITLIFVVTFLIVSLCFTIKYPDFMTAKVLVTTSQPTEKVITRYSGQIEQLYIKNRDTVKVNQYLAVIKNTANIDHVRVLKEILDSIPKQKFPFHETSNFILGDISTAYNNFEESYAEYYLFETLDRYYNDFKSEETSLLEMENRLKNQIVQKKILDLELKLKEKDLSRNRKLFKENAISELNYESKQLEFLQTQKNISIMDNSISQTREAISIAKRTLTNTIINKKEDSTVNIANLTQTYESLKEAVRNWEYNYVLKSSINGVVSFHDYWGVNQNVKLGNTVFSILPVDTSELIGKLEIPSQNAGKVKIGQKVFIKLDNYPHQQYGSVLGQVTNISSSTNNEGNYTIFISLPNGTKTSYNINIGFTQEMIGSAEIITEDLSIAERIFYKFREILRFNN